MCLEFAVGSYPIDLVSEGRSVKIFLWTGATALDEAAIAGFRYSTEPLFL